MSTDIRSAVCTLCSSNSNHHHSICNPSHPELSPAAASSQAHRQRLRSGICLRTGLICPGVFASHSCERTHIDSVSCTAELLLAYKLNKMKSQEFNAHPGIFYTSQSNLNLVSRVYIIYYTMSVPHNSCIGNEFFH